MIFNGVRKWLAMIKDHIFIIIVIFFYDTLHCVLLIDTHLLFTSEPAADLSAKRATEGVVMIKNQVKTKGTIRVMVTHDERLFESSGRMLY
ncbi:hypothetical protein BUY32_06485, partial [Staphylococcus cohnii]